MQARIAAGYGGLGRFSPRILNRLPWPPARTKVRTFMIHPQELLVVSRQLFEDSR
jgi:hypothetical protein